MDKTEYDIQRGERASLLLAEPLLAEAFEQIESEYIEQWKNSPVRDEAGREKLWLMVVTLKKFRGELESVVNTGKLAKYALEQETLAQQVGRMLNRSS